MTRPCDSQQKKKTCWIMDFTISADHRVKLKENKKRNKYIDLARELKSMEHESNGDTDCNWGVRENSQRIDKGTGKL